MLGIKIGLCNPFENKGLLDSRNTPLIPCHFGEAVFINRFCCLMSILNTARGNRVTHASTRVFRKERTCMQCAY